MLSVEERLAKLERLVGVQQVTIETQAARIETQACRIAALETENTELCRRPPQVLALIAVLTADGHMSRRKVRSLLSAVFGLDVSLGTLSESEQIVSDAVAPAVDEARMHALTEKVKHLDATSWRESGKYRSLWTLATATVTVFTILGDGTRAALMKWIDRVRGVLVTDRGAQFNFWALERRQLCWAHLIRKFASFSERRGRAGEIGADLLLWSRVLLHAWHRVRDGTGTRVDLRRMATNVRALMEQLLDEGAALPVKGFQGACRNILEHRNTLWRFVNDANVEPTNKLPLIVGWSSRSRRPRWWCSRSSG